MFNDYIVTEYRTLSLSPGMFASKMMLYCVSGSHFVSDMRWNFNQSTLFKSPWSILFPLSLSVGGLKVRLLEPSDSNLQSAQGEKIKIYRRIEILFPFVLYFFFFFSSSWLTALCLPLRLSNCSGQSKYPLAKVNRLNDQLLDMLLHLSHQFILLFSTLSLLFCFSFLSLLFLSQQLIYFLRNLFKCTIYCQFAWFYSFLFSCLLLARCMCNACFR